MKYEKGNELKTQNSTIKILKVEDGYYVVQYQNKVKAVRFFTDEELVYHGYTLNTPKAPPNDTRVEVRNREYEEWEKRYSTGEFYKDGDLLCWTDGQTSWSAEGDELAWKYWRLAE